MMGEKYRKLLHVLRDTGMSLQERLFRLLMTIGLIGISVGTMIGIALGESIYSTLMLLAAIVVFAVITALSIHFRKIQAGAVITSLLVLLFVLPYNFLRPVVSMEAHRSGFCLVWYMCVWSWRTGSNMFCWQSRFWSMRHAFTLRFTIHSM